MASDEEMGREEKPQIVSQLEPSRKGTHVCKRRCLSTHLIYLYLFPVCAFLASLVLVSLAFKTPRPGISLGSSFLLFILAIVYCAIANALRSFCLPSDERDSDSEKSYVTVDMTSLEEGELAINTDA